jgi:hypothetical protein
VEIAAIDLGICAGYEYADVLELAGADHGLAAIEHLQQIVDTVAEFSARL